MKSLKTFARLAIFVTLGLMWILVGCTGGDKAALVVPDEDVTPPVVRLLIPGNPGYELSSEDGENVEIDINPEETLAVQATATDRDGGVKEVEVTFKATVWCINSGVGGGAHPDVDLRNAADVDEQVQGPGDEARTVRSVSLTLPNSAEQMTAFEQSHYYACDERLALVGEVQAAGENVHGVRTDSPVFQFTAVLREP